MDSNAMLASAQTPAAPQDRSTQFVPVEGGATPKEDAGTFLVLAYVLMWLVTVLFIGQTWRKIRGVQTRLDELQKAVSKLPQAGE
jgi:hypothetical protein